MEIKKGEVHIWRFTQNEKEYEVEKTAPLLSVQEQERCDKYLREAEKIRYTCNHRFVRQVLAKYLQVPPSGIPFSQSTLGKPFVKNSGLFFNYSYRGSLGLLAISGQEEVGVDIEKMKLLSDPPTFAAFSFSEKERAIIFSRTGELFQETLFTFWTFKEAIIKALGVGLNADLTQIDLADFLHEEVGPLAYDKEAIYTMRQLKAPAGYKAAFAVRGRINTCTEFDYTGN